MSKAEGSTNVGIIPHSEKMVCVACFRTKTDRDVVSPCQNPKCHFYLPPRSESSPTSSDDVFLDDSPGSFYKDVGHSRKTRTIGGQPCGAGSGCLSNMWGCPPSAHLNLQVAAHHKQRSKSMSARTGENLGLRGALCTLGESALDSKDGGIVRVQHSRLMSLPNPMDAFLKSDGGTAFVDDSLASPFGDNERFVTPENYLDCDGDRFRPFGRGSGILDWSDSSRPKLTTVASHVPVASSIPCTSNAFDMTQLKLAVSRTMDCQSRIPALSNGCGSPDSQKFTASHLGALLGFCKPGQCTETYSRKVFIGGLPPDVDENDIRVFFLQFGLVSVDWPHKNHSKACIPPKGYAFLLFKSESSVHKLLLSCISERDNHFIYMPSSTMSRKKVQIRPWYIADSFYSVDLTMSVDPRKAVFVGGVPRPLKASELAEVMAEKYGAISLIFIDSDSDLKYPKGAACVVFASHASYIAAVSARFMQLTYGNLDKKIEIKPYVMDGQMCDECNGVQCSGKPAPFFCGSVNCLQYYCEYCWGTVHSMPGRQNHRPLLKDIGDKARFY